ncbi:hypothetical protein BN2476_1040002 [Paraburkholderia piptadeniae]|uniref:Uncharacterized protein n=1 Tax=Paraburkholderia piptadeniae TaxID=1701573 RepID=A0A1N7SUM7_9BURK|nr:hypothetical protein BN2476_1040002 [Paraburkholderia piptadeniae]
MPGDTQANTQANTLAISAHAGPQLAEIAHRLSRFAKPAMILTCLPPSPD